MGFCLSACLFYVCMCEIIISTEGRTGYKFERELAIMERGERRRDENDIVLLSCMKL